MGHGDGFVDAVALIGAVRDKSAESARLMGAAEALHRLDETARTKLARRAHELTQARLAGKLSPREFEEHYKYGTQMSIDQIVEDMGVCLA